MVPERCIIRRTSFFSSAWKRPSNYGNRIRQFSYSRTNRSYDDTIANLKIGTSTRVIFQGFTGKQGTANARESLEWGTNIVGGVKPNSEGEHLGLPVLPSVRKAVEVLKPDATGIYVAAHQAPHAIEEAIEAEVPLIVAVAEHIPLHNILRIHSMLKTQSKSRLVGANAPGIISPIGRCRIGFQPLPQFSPGPVGIVAKSGTLSYETVASLTRTGVGQSLCIGMGGDIVAGTDFVDALKVFEHDDDTQAIIIVGEVGGTAEEDAAEWIKDYRKRCSNPKPIAALVGGMCAIPGKVFGHAGAWAGPGEGSAEDKWTALEGAGAVMVDHPAKFGETMKRLLALPPSQKIETRHVSGTQKRAIHTLRRRPHIPVRSILGISKRTLHLTPGPSVDLLREYNIELSSNEPDLNCTSIAGITIHRTARSPCILVSSTARYSNALKIPFDFLTGPEEKHVTTAIAHLGLPEGTHTSFHNLITNLWSLFLSKDGISLLLKLGTTSSSTSSLSFSSPTLQFDDSAFRIGKRHATLHAQRATETIDPQELAAEPYGIVYVRLSSNDLASCNVGTLVNGAGLAMNAVDALAARGVFATNFCDTGGHATSATVAAAFGLLLADPRVKVIFVNIFGGLTLGDMIARGVLMAFQEKEVSVPVVVRIRGTNEREGQRIIAESGLPLFAYDDFEEAVAKIKELLEQSGRPSRL